MPSSVWEFIGTKNANLVRFCDRNPNIAGLFMKLANQFENISREKHVPPGRLRFKATGNNEGDRILIWLEW